jgi:hypothetical protein
MGIVWRGAHQRGLVKALSLGVSVLAGVWLCCLVLAGGALAVGDETTAAGEACPNEEWSGFRTFMPECRAYEQVTPVFKDGSEAKLEYLSADGSNALVESLGAFAGTESDSEVHGSVYELSRTSSGWTVTAASPPASEFPAQKLAAASPELGSTLWLTRTPSESIAAEDLYLREADGSMVRIGSMLPPAAVTGPPAGEFEGFLYKGFVVYRDASADLSHVLFSIEEPRAEGLGWPGDTTMGKESLYEYTGTGQSRPELVGVNNEGRLISPCSTYLGSRSSQDVYNAVSSNGGIVYFTAEEASECHATEGPEVPELYARVDGFETVAISEPSPQQCDACQTSAKSAAEFAGASQDGSKVFFTTEQELLPGATGKNLYEYDFDAPPGKHVILVSPGTVPGEQVNGVARVSDDGSHVYFVAGARLSKGARGGKNGPCIAELGSAERTDEAEAEKEEERNEPVVHSSRCRPTPGEDNLYVFERDAAHPAGQVSFVATLLSRDASDWSATDERQVQTTPEGRFLVFRSAADLTAGDTSSEPQLFEYDALTGELVRVSRGSDNYEPQGTEHANKHPAETSIQGFKAITGPAKVDTGLMVSADGATVLFGDVGALAKEAAGAAPSVEAAYEYRSSVGSGGAISDGDVYLISDGSGLEGKGIKGVKGLDSSGEDLFFVTAASLVASDTDEQFDTYDARRDGGFAAVDPPPECMAEACGGSLYLQPAFAAPGSTGVSDGGPPSNSSLPPGAVPAGKKGTAAVGRGELLARALAVCRRERGRRRATCEALASKRFGPHRKAKKIRGGGK